MQTSTAPAMPTGNNILVKKLPNDKISKGGIYIPDNVKPENKVVQAKVIAVGPGKFYDNDEGGRLVEPAVKVGDTVIINNWGTIDIKLDDVEYTFVKETAILAVNE